MLCVILRASFALSTCCCHLHTPAVAHRSPTAPLLPTLSHHAPLAPLLLPQAVSQAEGMLNYVRGGLHGRLHPYNIHCLDAMEPLLQIQVGLPR